MARSRIPREVLARARAEATRVEAKSPSPSPAATAPASPVRTEPAKREKIVRALRKLHPMD